MGNIVSFLRAKYACSHRRGASRAHRSGRRRGAAHRAAVAGRDRHRQQLSGPSAAHWLGTDFFGRDLLSRVLNGGRATLAIGIGVVAIAFVIGTAVGIAAGFFSGWIDMISMRFVDALLSFPSLVLAIALAAAFGPSLQNAMLAVAITLAPQFARVARGQALAISACPMSNRPSPSACRPPRSSRATSCATALARCLCRRRSASARNPADCEPRVFGTGGAAPDPEWGADVSAKFAIYPLFALGRAGAGRGHSAHRARVQSHRRRAR